MADHWVNGGSDRVVHLAVEGEGPVVLLLAGTGQEGSDWGRAGYVAATKHGAIHAAISRLLIQ